ncbi:hypothetical protein LTR36_009293 [Oleoguttula mirabilis]|uniref:Glycosyltransferase family 32 protein n=1 Tax=Oleoguttula mirabilis TaxID=1507867 RepID=A0AAV9J645_9PEZI|nr:hypothetical protein LTR36_009293 [Oleoguttula mirabilis]
MRPRTIIAVCFMALAAFLVLNRCHIRDLYEVARTYATYHNFMQRHPEILYRYSPEALESSNTLDRQQQAPKIIHQIYLQEGRNSTLHKYAEAQSSCQSLHRTWTHLLWTDDNATTFMRRHYPSIAPHYEGYAQSIQRANVLRYALLHHFGGVYLDLDVTCLAPLDSLLHLPLLTPGAYPAGVNNAFILARPRHGFLFRVLQGVAGRDMRWPMPYVENMLSTGCMFFTNRWMDYARDLQGRIGVVAEEDKVYTLADRYGNTEPHMLRGKATTPLFTHGGASSWHSWDAAVIVLIGEHYGYFLMLVGAGLVALVCLMWKLRSRSNGGEGWSSHAHARRSMEKRDDEERMLAGKAC